MEKSKLEKFINKYNLGGACESVLLKSDGSTLSVRGISDDKNVLEEISVERMNFPKGEFCVYDTKKLRAILSVLEESLTVSAQITGDKVTALNMEDGSTKTTFVLADPTVMNAVPELKSNPSPDLVIKLDATFMSTFIKAKNALSEVDTFAVTSTGESNTATVTIGYSSINTNRIVLNVNTEKPSKLDPVLFSANYLKEILSANKEVTNGTLEISSKGLAKAHFDHDGTVATYYLVQVKS